MDHSGDHPPETGASQEQGTAEVILKEAEGEFTESHVLSALLKEYELLSQRGEENRNRVVQIVAGGLGAIGLVAGLVLSMPSSISVGLAWLAPLSFFMIFAFLIYGLYLLTANSWATRLVTQRINSILDQSVLVRTEPGLPEYEFFSLTRGSAKVRLVYAFLVGGSVAAMAVVISTSFGIVDESSRLAGTIFIVVYAALTILGLVAASVFLFDLPRYYREFFRQLHVEMSGDDAIFGIRSGALHPGRIGPIPRGGELGALHPGWMSVRGAFAALLPRPFDVLVKGHYFFIGFFFALETVGLQSAQVPLLDSLFGNGQPWRQTSEVPGWAVGAFGFLSFAVLELLLQQGKLMWDDLRDAPRDQQLPLNRQRAIAQGLLTRPAAVYNMVVRVSLALVLGLLIGGLTLLALYLLIMLHEAVYVLWAKPHGRRFPLFPLFVIGFNAPLRFLAGVIAVLGIHWMAPPFLLVMVLLYFASFGRMAMLWRIEARYLVQEGHAADSLAQIRPQSAFYFRNGKYWQRVGFLGAIMLSAGLVALQSAVIGCSDVIPFVNSFYGFCSSTTPSPHYIGLDLATAVIAFLGGILVTLVVSMFLVVLTNALGIVAVLVVVLAVIAPLVWVMVPAAFPTGMDVSSCCGQPWPWLPSQPFAADLIGFDVLAVLVGLALVALLVFMSRLVGRIMARYVSKIAGIVAMLLYLSTAGAFIASVIASSSILLALSLVLFHAGYLVSYETITYEQYALIGLRRRIPLFGLAMYHYLLQPIPGLGLAQVLGILVGRVEIGKAKALFDRMGSADQSVSTAGHDGQEQGEVVRPASLASALKRAGDQGIR